MSRAQYQDDFDDPLELGRWRAQVASATRGRRGQAFLRETLAALDAMPVKRLVLGELQEDGEVCTIGATLAARGVDASAVDPEDYEAVAKVAGIAEPLAREIEYYNDEGCCWPADNETPEQRWKRMRAWVASQITDFPARPRGWGEETLRVLALDLGLCTGWATNTPGGILHGEEDFHGKRHESTGMRYLMFERWILAVLTGAHGARANALMAGASLPLVTYGFVELVAYELIRRHEGTQAAHVYGALQGLVTKTCESLGINYRGFEVADIKRHGCKKGNAKKAEMVVAAACILAGHGTPASLGSLNHNEADAICLLDLCLKELGVAAARP